MRLWRRAVLAVTAITALASCAGTNPVAPAAAPAVPAAALRHKIPNDPALLGALGDPAKRLLPLLVALEALETGRLDRPVSIIQIGDSHTANFAFAERMRELFTERFGAAGRGMLAPGIPHQWYMPQQVKVTETPGWQHFSSFDRQPIGPFGISAVRERGSHASDQMVLTAQAPEGFDRVLVEVLRQPGGGSLDIRLDGVAAPAIATAAASAQAQWIEVPTPAGSHVLALSPHGDGPVDLLSWTTERRQPGILYENFGTIGASVDLIGHWDPAVIAADLAERDPALILVAFGTNEGFGQIQPAAYQASYADRVGLLQRSAPLAAIVSIGPPDGNRAYRRPPGTTADCVQNSFGEAPSPSGPRAIWATPPGIALVRQAERAAAAEHGWYFWDWQAVMGGACAMHRWTKLNPPLGAEDHVHMREAGYRLSAEKLFDELMVYYDRYRALRPATASTR